MSIDIPTVLIPGVLDIPDRMPVRHTRFWIGIDILRSWSEKAPANSTILYYKGFISIDLQKEDQDLKDQAKSANFLVEQLYMSGIFDPVQRKLAPGYYEYYLQRRQSRDKEKRFWRYGREVYKESNQ